MLVLKLKEPHTSSGGTTGGTHCKVYFVGQAYQVMIATNLMTVEVPECNDYLRQARKDLALVQLVMVRVLMYVCPQG